MEARTHTEFCNQTKPNQTDTTATITELTRRRINIAKCCMILLFRTFFTNVLIKNHWNIWPATENFIQTSKLPQMSFANTKTQNSQYGFNEIFKQIVYRFAATASIQYCVYICPRQLKCNKMAKKYCFCIVNLCAFVFFTRRDLFISWISWFLIRLKSWNNNINKKRRKNTNKTIWYSEDVEKPNFQVIHIKMQTKR